jgi:hypothetical protein
VFTVGGGVQNADQLLLVHTDVSQTKLLAAPSAPIREIAISGDGSTVFASTSDARLLEVDAARNGIREIVSAPPLITQITGSFAPLPFPPFVPGSQYRIAGSGLSGSGEHPA